jgi:hypothetical protein
VGQAVLRKISIGQVHAMRWSHNSIGVSIPPLVRIKSRVA